MAPARLNGMTTRLLLAKRINNGQSEIWLDAELEKRIVVATNGNPASGSHQLYG